MFELAQSESSWLMISFKGLRFSLSQKSLSKLKILSFIPFRAIHSNSTGYSAVPIRSLELFMSKSKRYLSGFSIKVDSLAEIIFPEPTPLEMAWIKAFWVLFYV